MVDRPSSAASPALAPHLRSALKRASSTPPMSPEILPVTLPSATSSDPVLTEGGALAASSLSPSPSASIPTLTVSSSSPVLADLPSSQLPQSNSGEPCTTPSWSGSSAANTFTPKVSFDTFENPAASMFSFTLQVKSDGYRRTRNTRVFLCAASPDESGREALDWALESLVQNGDELIVYRGIEQDELENDHDVLRDEARDLMRRIQEKSVEYDADRKLSLILEYIPGRVTQTIDRLIALYRPDSVVVGTRGRRTWQGMGFGMGSVSKHCLSHSPVPIIVVRPERKVKKVLEKRRADPKRGTHFDELARTGSLGSQNGPSTPASSQQP